MLRARDAIDRTYANALDIRTLRLGDGKAIHPTDPHVSREFRESLRASVCARFSTVLGPGSDGFHEDHIHVDLAERRGGYRICQWDVRDPLPEIVPLPRPRPAFEDEKPSAAPPGRTKPPARCTPCPPPTRTGGAHAR